MSNNWNIPMEKKKMELSLWIVLNEEISTDTQP